MADSLFKTEGADSMHYLLSTAKVFDLDQTAVSDRFQRHIDNVKIFVSPKSKIQIMLPVGFIGIFFQNTENPFPHR